MIDKSTRNKKAFRKDAIRQASAKMGKVRDELIKEALSQEFEEKLVVPDSIVMESEPITVEKLLELDKWAKEHSLREIKPMTPEQFKQLRKDMRCPIDN